MLRRFGFALRPGWILFHLFTRRCVVTMVLLGRWQLHVSESKHFSLQNFGYTIQWWLFSRLRRSSCGGVSCATPPGAVREATDPTPARARTAAHRARRLPSLRHAQRAAAERRPGARGLQRLPGDLAAKDAEDAVSEPASEPMSAASVSATDEGGRVSEQGFNLGKGVLDHRQPPVPAAKVAGAAGTLRAYRFMAFLTGVVLLSGCIALILKYGDVPRHGARHRLPLGRPRLPLPHLRHRHRRPRLQAALAAGPLRAGDAGRDDPDAVLRRRALRHPRDPRRGRDPPVAGPRLRGRRVIRRLGALSEVLLALGLLLAAPGARARRASSRPTPPTVRGCRRRRALVTVTFDEGVRIGGVGYLHVTDEGGSRVDARAA